jgi:hypothetical protein
MAFQGFEECSHTARSQGRMGRRLSDHRLERSRVMTIMHTCIIVRLPDATYTLEWQSYMIHENKARLGVIDV